MIEAPLLNISGNSGSVEVICGPMFSGKTEDLIRRIQAVQNAGLPAQAFKPRIDTRYSANELVSHNGMRLPAQSLHHSSEILAAALPGAVIGIDEAQFWDAGLPAVVEMLSRRNHRVILAGLDLDAAGVAFDLMTKLRGIATENTLLKATCAQCGAPAGFSFRKIASHARILLGASESYEPRCQACYKEGIRKAEW